MVLVVPGKLAERGLLHHAQENIPAQTGAPEAAPRFPGPYGHPCRQRGVDAAPPQGTSPAGGVAGAMATDAQRAAADRRYPLGGAMALGTELVQPASGAAGAAQRVPTVSGGFLGGPQAGWGGSPQPDSPPVTGGYSPASAPLRMGPGYRGPGAGDAGGLRHPQESCGRPVAAGRASRAPWS